MTRVGVSAESGAEGGVKEKPQLGQVQVFVVDVAGGGAKLKSNGFSFMFWSPLSDVKIVTLYAVSC